MENYQPNSHKSRNEVSAEKKKVQSVVKGTVKTKKKSELKKISDIFISDDVSNVKSYIVMDVLIPAAKKAIFDVVTNGIDMILYGTTGHTKRSSNPASKVSYGSFFNNNRDPREPYRMEAYNYDEISFEYRSDAEAVLMQMDEMMSTYQIVSVADLYDLVGKTCPYTANNYGWTDIRSAQVIRTREGYKIKLPKALPLK